MLAQGILIIWSSVLRQASSSQAAVAGSEHNAYTDYAINLNLILLHPTYRMSLIHSYLNANAKNLKLRDAVNPFTACVEKWALLRCD